MAIKIYTDGSSKGNPGKGGYGIVIKKNETYIEISKDRAIRIKERQIM